jgi:predicted MFS family arabinose efflux permease
MSLITAATPLSGARAALIFLSFALAYFLSALLRAVTATLAPIFSSEFGLRAADLGLLAGAYFFGFAIMQLPLGAALDRFGPRHVVSSLLVMAALGCVGFATADSLLGLIAARAVVGVGVAACLMGPLTWFRRAFAVHTQLRVNSWMLMTGSLGMVASTMPVQSLLPLWGWRGLFLVLAGCLAGSIVLILWLVPGEDSGSQCHGAEQVGYWQIARDPTFRSLAPLGFVVYGGLIAVQSLWAGPWLTRVAGWSPAMAAEGLFGINCSMLIAFAVWGSVMPGLARRGVTVGRLLAGGVPLSLIMLAIIVALGQSASAWHWAAWCVSTTVVTLSQPAVGYMFARHVAGRALSAFNLIIFSGVFALQWGIGLVIDGLVACGWRDEQAFQLAFCLFAMACAAAYSWYLWARPRECR